MKKYKFLAISILAAMLVSCGGNDGVVTEKSPETSAAEHTAEVSVTDSTEAASTAETSVTTTADVPVSENAAAVSTAETSVTTAADVTVSETTVYDPADAMELTVDNLLMSIEGWVYNDGIRDESACYFFCILEDGTVYTMKYSVSESDFAGQNAFADKLYSCDNSAWDLAENVKAVGNIFSQMSREMLMEDFYAINWSSDYYGRNADEETPAVVREYYLTSYLYPLLDGKKTAVFAESDGCYIMDDRAAEFMRLVNYSDVYKEWKWQLWHFSKGDLNAEFKIYTDSQELCDAGVEDIYYSKDNPEIVSRIKGNYSTFKIFDGDTIRSVEQVKNFIGCKSAFDEFKRDGGGHILKQVYNGIPVYNGRVEIIVGSDGYPDELMSSYVPNINIDVSPKLSSSAALEAAESMDVIKAYGTPELCIVKNHDVPEPVLAWAVNVEVKERTYNGAWYDTEISKRYCFDANTGEFLTEYPLAIPN